MKKFFKTTLALMAMVSLVSLGGCQKASKEDINPTYDGEAVKTQFTISMPSQLKSKMTYGTVQEAQSIASFRGMQDIVIIPYLDPADRTTRWGSNITLYQNTLAKPTTTNDQNSIPEGQLLTNSNAVIYNDVTVPLRTSGFLFYGKAKGEDGYANGKLTVAGMTDESADISFSPATIVESVNKTKGDAIAAYVSAIAAAKAGDALGERWYDFTTANNDKAWYIENLDSLYKNFTSLKPGASSYVQAAVQDLYRSVFNSANPVAAAIKTAILTKAVDNAPADGVLDSWDETISNYPGGDNNGMPDGSAALKWDGNTPNVATAVDSATNGGMTQAMAKIVYPASLYYYANSALKVSNESRKDDYNTTNSWTAILAAYTDGASVVPSTRSVAIEDPIQYAVGRLDTKVNMLNATNYYDRRGDEVVIPTEGFKLTGVLIGGQKAVNYEFVPTNSIEYAIYDTVINTQNSSSRYVTKSLDGGVNYTLALPTAKDKEVYVALEFLNDGTNAADFQGYDGVVKKGCKFYMIARLNPTAATGVTGYDASDMNQVFKADHKTLANFTIAAGTPDTDNDHWSDTPAGFANAYVTIPDLRTPQLELGFSVDLSWQSGLSFDVTF